jgi:hypothetical protein
MVCYGWIPAPRKMSKHTNCLANILVAWVLKKINKVNRMASMPKMQRLPEGPSHVSDLRDVFF